MIDRVVVPVDFSAESDRALVVAPVLATWAGAGVELLTVVEPSARATAEPRLAEAARRVGDWTTCKIVESGGPREAALLTELHAGRKELWCVGSHARGSFSDLFLESVSEDLVRDAHMPVVLVGPHCTTAPTGRFLVVALDGTTESEDILPAAADLALALGMTLRLLQVAKAGVEQLPRIPSRPGTSLTSPKRSRRSRARRSTTTSSTATTRPTASPTTSPATLTSGWSPFRRPGRVEGPASSAGAPPSTSPIAPPCRC